MKKRSGFNYFSLAIIAILVFSHCFSLIQSEELEYRITITADENKLYNYISLGGFMENCYGTDTKHIFSGVSDTVDLFLDLNLDDQTVSGTLSGSGSDTKCSYAYENHWDFTGSISGTITKVLSGSWYHWKLSGIADITLNCTGSLRCFNENSQQYEIITEEKQLMFSANLSGDSYASEDGFSQYSIYWEDEGGLGGNTQSFSIKCGDSTGYSDCSLTNDLPDQNNLSVSLNGPNQIGKATTSALLHHYRVIS